MKLFVAIALLAACEHTNKPADQNNAPAAAPAQPAPPTPKPADDMKPEPVAKAPPAAPAATDDVRPPVASDLADYVKDIKGSGQLMATIETDKGTIHCELFDDKAPIGVASFVGLATGKKPWMNPNTHQVEKGKPYFDGLTFHRVIAGFMIQGGDPTGSGRGGPGYRFDNEIDRALKMDPGALAYANAGPGTNGSQFFIMEGSKPQLLGGYTIFGQCKEVDVVAKITHVPTSGPPEDRAETPTVMKKVTISRGK
jgi:peptidyl-prolyl cis-trans isomerase A (cyclophilin A)